MDNEFSFEITNESKNAINEILKQQGLRHFKLYTDFYGELDVINYEEYQKLEKEKDKEIERLNNIIKPKEVNYNYLKLLFEKKDKEEVIKSYVYKCEQLEKLYKSYEEKEIEVMKKDNIIDELEKYFEEEQTRLARECSNIYEDDLGRTRLVNEDIFNEITRIKDKLKTLKEGK